MSSPGTTFRFERWLCRWLTAAAFAAVVAVWLGFRLHAERDEFDESHKFRINLLLWTAIAVVATRIDWGRVRGKAKPCWRGFYRHLLLESWGHLLKRRALALLLILISFGLTILCQMTISGIVLAFFQRNSYLPMLLIAVVPLLIATRLVWISGLRRWTQRGEALLRRDARRPILYLRSFVHDAGMLDREQLNVFRWLFARFSTAEQDLAEALDDVGPVLAIGKPGEKLPSLGAARLYIEDDWQHVVAELVAQSKLVVIRIGQTPGYWWEIEHLVGNCDPRKLLVYVTRADTAERYAAWHDHASPLFPKGVPKDVTRPALIGFTADWSPVHKPVRRSFRAWIRSFLFIGTDAAQLRLSLSAVTPRSLIKKRRLPWTYLEWFFFMNVVIRIVYWLTSGEGVFNSRNF